MAKRNDTPMDRYMPAVLVMIVAACRGNEPKTAVVE